MFPSPFGEGLGVRLYKHPPQGCEGCCRGLRSQGVWEYYRHSGSPAQPCGKPMAAASTVGYFASRAFRSAAKEFYASMPFSQ